MSIERVGYGRRNADLLAVLGTLTPAATQVANWGEMQLRICAYLSQERVPDALVTSVRCLVEVDRKILVTESPDDVSILPGGRRERGESMRQTALREVYEETGYEPNPASLKLLGFLHFQHLIPPPEDYPYPHPDFLQLVFQAQACPRGSDVWKDTDRYVLRSWLEPPAQARHLNLEPVTLPFLDAHLNSAR